MLDCPLPPPARSADRPIWDLTLRELSELAARMGIGDISQDNALRTIQVLTRLDILALPGRQGNDVIDRLGQEYELKTVDLSKGPRGFGTSHHLNPHLISKYRQVPWLFATFSGMMLTDVYLADRECMRPLLDKWEQQWHARGGKDLNNPKISLVFVKEHCRKVCAAL